MRRNAEHLADHQDTLLQLALLESAAGNHSEAQLICQSAFVLYPSSTTALCTMATVSANAGHTKRALLAAALVHVPSRRREGEEAVWPQGTPPHSTVTLPSGTRHLDADAAIHAIVVEEPWWTLQEECACH